MLKGELKNNSRKPRDLVRKTVQLSPSQGKKKKGDDVAIDEDDDAVRTSVSQDQVIAPLCTKELFLCSVFTALPTYQKLNHEGGEDLDSQYDTFSRPSWVSHFPAGPHYSLQGFQYCKTWFVCV
jgi:hypothetical protein